MAEAVRYTALVEVPRWTPQMRDALVEAGAHTWREADETFTDEPTQLSLDVDAASEGDARAIVTRALAPFAQLHTDNFPAIRPTRRR